MTTQAIVAPADRSILVCVRLDGSLGRALRELQADHPETARRIVVSLDRHDRTTEDGIELLHHRTFLTQLWQGSLF